MQLGSDRAPTSLPKALRVLPVSDGVLFPRGILELALQEPHDIELINDAMGSDRLIGVVQSNEDDGSVSESTFYRTGCLGRVKQFTDEEDGTYAIKLRGLLRFAITKELRVASSYRQCRVDFEPFIRDLPTQRELDAVNREAVLNTLDRFIAAYPQRIDWDAIHEASNEILVNGLAIQGPFSRAEKQALLEAHDLEARAEILISLLEFEVTKASGPS
jgi:Lon protease-like protein